MPLRRRLQHDGGEDVINAGPQRKIPTLLIEARSGGIVLVDLKAVTAGYRGIRSTERVETQEPTALSCSYLASDQWICSL